MQIFKSKFVRNIVLVATGTAGAQAITMAFAPLITRLYNPEDFGVLGVFVSLLAVLTPIAALTYPVAIVLPKSDDDAKGLAKLSLLLACLIAILLLLIIILKGSAMANFLNMEVISAYLWLMPIAMLFSVMQEVMQQWLIRKNKFKATARIAVSQSLIFNTTKASAGWLYPSGIMLIIITALGNALYAIQLWFAANRCSDLDSRINTPIKNKSSLKRLAYAYRDFPYFRAPQVLLNAVSKSFPTLLLASFFSPAIAGFFALSNSVLAAPAGLIGSSVSNVFYPKVSGMINNEENPSAIFYKSTFVLFLVSVFVFLPVVLFGPKIFSLIFSDKWLVAGQFAQFTSIWLILFVATRPTVALMAPLKLQSPLLVFEIIFTMLKVVSVIVGAFVFDSYMVSIAIYSISSAVFYVFLFLLVVHKIRAVYRVS